MADNGAIKGLFVAIGVDVPDKDVKKAETALGGLTKLAAGLAAAFVSSKLIGGLNNIINKTAELGDNIAKAALRTGIAAESLKQWHFVAGLAGVSTQALEGSFIFLARNMEAAAQGSKLVADAFKDLGLNAEELQQLSPEEAFLKSADAIGKVENANKRAAMATAIFGRSGAQLIPLFLQGTGAIADQVEEAKALGIAFSDDAVQGTQDLIDNQLRLDTVFLVLEETIGNVLIPVVNNAMELFIDWWKVNKDLLRQPLARLFTAVGKAMEVVAAATVPVLVLFTSILSLNEELGGVPLTFLAISAAAIAAGVSVFFFSKSLLWLIPIMWKMIAAAVAAKWAMVTAAWAAFVAWAATIGPLWLVIGAILVLAALFGILIFLIQDLWTWIKGGNSVIDKLSDKIAEFVDDGVSYWMDKFGELGDWFGKWFDKINAYLSNTMIGKIAMKMMGFVGDIAEFNSIGQDSPFSGPRGSDQGMSLDPNFDPSAIGMTAADGPGGLSSTSNRSNMSFSAQTKVDVNVQAGPGQSAEDVGNAAARAGGSVFENALREAYIGMTPSTEVPQEP